MTLIHILDHKTDKILGDSSKFRNDNHYESLNNEETFYFVEPDTSKIAPFLNKKNRVIIPLDDGFFREFIIAKAIQTRNEIEVFTKASYIELKSDEPIAPVTLNGATVNTSMDHVLARSDWKRGITDYSGTTKVEFEEHITPYAALKKIASLFGLELRFRIETKNGIVTGRYVDMIEHVGEWRGKEIVSGKDLINARRIEKNESVVTALYVIGPQKEDGSYDVVKVRNEEARQNWGRKGKHLWDIYIPQTEDVEITRERLIELGEQELNKRISAHVGYEIEGADIESVFGREHEKVRLGDNARVKATEYNPPIYLDSRIISREGPIRVKSQKKYILGEFIEYTEDEIKKNIKFLEKQIAKKIGEAQLVEYAEKKIPELDYEPDPNEYPKYIDISGEVPKLMMWDGERYTTIKGDQGIPGAPGEDGRTPYFHTAFANSEDGTVDFNITDSADRRYMGHYTDFSQADSNDPSKYTWTPLYDNVKVGGRNLLKNSTWNFGTDNWQGAWNETYQILEPESDKPSSRILQILSASATSQKYNTPFLVEIGKEYTVSVDIKVDEVINSTTNLFAIRTFASPDLANSQANSTSTWYPFRQKDIEKSGEWQRLSFTFTADDKWLRVMPYNSEVGKKAYFREIMVEESNIPMPWQEAPEDTQAKIDEAKQAADNAQESADGKNTVFRQSTQPSTANRKVGDLWFDTGNGNRMYVWTGSWTLNKLDYQALAVGKLSAISVDLGTVTAGILKAIELEGVTGTFNVLWTIFEDEFSKRTVKFENGVGIYETHHKTDGTTDTIVIGANGIAHDSSGLGANNDFQIASRNNLIFSSARGLDVRFLDGIFTQKISGEIHQALSLLNGWLNYGSGAQAPRAIKYPTKQVILEGSVRSGLVGEYTMAVLPVGMRPSASLSFKTDCSNNGDANIWVYSNGDIRVLSSDSNARVSLSGITFHAV